jgi:hypothetical protein
MVLSQELRQASIQNQGRIGCTIKGEKMLAELSTTIGNINPEKENSAIPIRSSRHHFFYHRCYYRQFNVTVPPPRVRTRNAGPSPQR